MKKILLLGGSSQQVIAIETAKKLGYYTVLCDYLTDNPGQYHADKFYLVSTTDKNAILEVAEKEKVDGVLAYASDPAAPTASYVAEKMGLPTNPHKSVDILCNKDKFREFLAQNGFNTPKALGFSSLEQIVSAKDQFRLPVIIKPVDSSGSKGASVLYSWNGLEKAVTYALSYSRNHKFIVEEFIEKGYPNVIGGDVFLKDGKIAICGLMDCHRDSKVNPLVPVGKSYPCKLEKSTMKKVNDTIESILEKLSVKNGAVNVELIVDKNNEIWPIDFGPRNGGNMIPDLMSDIFSTDIVELSVLTAMGEVPQIKINEPDSCYATHNLHSEKSGKFKDVWYSEKANQYIYKKYIYKKEGDSVDYFDNASKAIGIIFFKFPSADIMQEILSNINNHIKIITS